MGRNKLLLKIDGKTVIERCIGAFYDCCPNIIVVTGKYHENIRRCLSAYSKVRIVYNREYRQGMFSTVKTGAARVRSERFFLTPGDYPLLRGDTVSRMSDMPGEYIVPVYEGKPGHPVLLDKLFVPVILSSADISLRDCLSKYSVSRRELCVNDIGVITDIDTAEEYSALKHIEIPNQGIV